ncbi:unnamed protein product [Pieris macdunnoughi]|nr:unnamed protein product [Pieris macdunnoughi]
MIGPVIKKTDTKFRNAISVKERLSITLRFLASGDSFTSLQYTFRVSKQAISLIVPETCQAILNVLKQQIKLPNTPHKWEQISAEFLNMWNLPNAVGAMDGKHITLQAPFNSGSEFFNYKDFFSIVMFALVDASYNFLFVDVGCQGRISDGGVFNNSVLKTKIDNDSLNLPPPKALEGTDYIVPNYFVADSAFPLSNYIMKPYSGQHAKGSMKRVFNYRLSRARRVVENTFGILSSVFRLLRKPLLLEPEKAQLIVMTICHLHNFLRRSPNSVNTYTPRGTFDTEIEGTIVPGRWRVDNTATTSFLPITNTPRRPTLTAVNMRDQIAEYCYNVRTLPWQNDA